MAKQLRKRNFTTERALRSFFSEFNNIVPELVKFLYKINIEIVAGLSLKPWRPETKRVEKVLKSNPPLETLEEVEYQPIVEAKQGKSLQFFLNKIQI